MKGKHRSVCLCVPVNSWGPLGGRKKKKKSIFLSFPLLWPLGTNPKPTAIPPFPSHLVSSVLAHPKARWRRGRTDTSGALRHLLICPLPPPCPGRGDVLLCASSTRDAPGDLLSHPRGPAVAPRGTMRAGGRTRGVCSPKEPGCLRGLHGRRRKKTTKHPAACRMNCIPAVIIERRRRRGLAWHGLGSSCRNAALGNWVKANTV